jgi:pyruvate formate lyase activating enzyme
MREKEATPPVTLKQARDIALSLGLNFVYVGNVHNTEGQTTYCPNCHTSLITRDWHSVHKNIISKGRCPKCSNIIPGRFN